MPNNQEIQISVIVPCRNEIRSIRAFLDSVIRQDLVGLKVEVLIADGMSDDGTRDVLAQYEGWFPIFRILDNPQKIASAGLNTAIRAARGEVIVRMDAHSEYATDYVRNCFEILNETGAANVGGPALTRTFGYLGHAIALAYHTRFACGGARFHDPNYEGCVDTVTYGCWRKSTLERAGMFDENLVRCQDNELNLRLINAGEKIWQSPKIRSWYQPRCGVLPLFHQYFQYGFWKVAVIRKHGKVASWRHLVPGVCLLVAIGLLLGIVVAIVDGSTRWELGLTISAAAFAAIYCLISLVTTIVVSARNGWRFLFVLPIVFATYHLAYGLGFLLGLSYRPASWDLPSSFRRVLTTITR